MVPQFSTSCSSSSVQTLTTMQSSCWTSLGCRYIRWRSVTCQNSLTVWRRTTNCSTRATRRSWSTPTVLIVWRKVYVDATGTSTVTSDLREGDAGQRGAAYAVFAAVGLSVAESLLLGCDAVVVEGPSDQYYMTAIKNLLIGAGRLKPRTRTGVPGGWRSQGSPGCFEHSRWPRRDTPGRAVR